MFYLSDYYRQLQEKKGIEKRHTGPKPQSQTLNTYGDDTAFFQKSEGLPEVVYSTKNFSYNAPYETKETIKSIGKMIRQDLSAADVFVLRPPRENQVLFIPSRKI